MAAAAPCRGPLAWFFAAAAVIFFGSWYRLLDSAATPPARRPRQGLHLGGGGQLPVRKCDPAEALLRVFMYDLPPEFHFGLLDWKPAAGGSSVWPDVRGAAVPEYPGGLNLQHSIEYWLALNLLASEQGAPTLCAAVRVHDAADADADADVVLVPFFASLSFNRHSRVVPPARGSEAAAAAAPVRGRAGRVAQVRRPGPRRARAPPQRDARRALQALALRLRALRLRQVPAQRRQPRQGRHRAVPPRRPQLRQ